MQFDVEDEEGAIKRRVSAVRIGQAAERYGPLRFSGSLRGSLMP